MNTFTVSCFGHRQIKKPLIIEERLEKVVRELLTTKEYIEFLVGRSGDFDLLAASVIHRCKRLIRSDNSALVLVLPYATSEYEHNKSLLQYYDEIELCAAASASHFKSAYQTRNRSMIDRSDLVIFHVDHPSGGAYQTMRYALKNNKPNINLLF